MESLGSILKAPLWIFFWQTLCRILGRTQGQKPSGPWMRPRVCFQKTPRGTFNILPRDSIENLPLEGLHSPRYPLGFSTDCHNIAPLVKGLYFPSLRYFTVRRPKTHPSHVPSPPISYLPLEPGRLLLALAHRTVGLWPMGGRPGIAPANQRPRGDWPANGGAAAMLHMATARAAAAAQLVSL